MANRYVKKITGVVAILLAISLCLLEKPLATQAPTKEAIVNAVIIAAKSKSQSHYELIARLNCCENHCKWDTNKIIDSNSKYSYGGLMFQRDTFLRYGHDSGILPEWIDETNFRDYIYDQDIQTLIAEYMIKIGVANTTQGWLNCWNKYNLSQYL